MSELLKLFKDSGGWNEGHTSFKNGLHGNGWIEKGFILRFPQLLEAVTKIQADLVKQNVPNVELLIGPQINGSIIASHVGKHIDLPFTITTGKGEEVEFHRMYDPPKGMNVAIIEDLVFTGNDISANVKFLKNKGMIVQGIFVWINRQQGEINGVKVYSLIEPPFLYYKSDDCPLCKAGVPLKYENIRE